MTNYKDITPDQVDELRDLVVSYGDDETVETVEAIVELWKAKTGTGISRVTLDTSDVEFWKNKYTEDVPRLARELEEAQREVARLNTQLAAVAVQEDTSGDRSRDERQLTARMRVLIDDYLGKHTPRRIRDQADGVFPEDRPQEDHRSRRTRRRPGRHSHDYNTGYDQD